MSSAIAGRKGASAPVCANGSPPGWFDPACPCVPATPAVDAAPALDPDDETAADAVVVDVPSPVAVPGAEVAGTVVADVWEAVVDGWEGEVADAVTVAPQRDWPTMRSPLAIGPRRYMWTALTVRMPSVVVCSLNTIL